MVPTRLTRRLVVELHGIKGEVVYHQAHSIPTNTFVIQLPEERSLLSSAQGYKKARIIFNCYIPKPLDEYLQIKPRVSLGYSREMLKDVLNEYGTSFNRVVCLSTGVDMENLAWTEEALEDLWVVAFVTAGVKNNAIRIGKDRASGIEWNGLFKCFGTINIILLTNVSLNQPALASSFITITEAKNVALEELDIRSSYTPEWKATGTGTDQVITVSGTGGECAFVQGHTKIGEMMGRAVTRAMIEAIKKSSGLFQGRG